MTFYEILLHSALIVWTLIGIGALITMVIVGPQLMRALREFDDVADVIKNRALPVLEQSEDLLDQIGRISAVLIDDLEVIDRTIIRGTESVERMIELTEDRVSEMNALLSVAIEEAEDTFVSTAGLVRALIPGRRKRKKRWLGGGERRRFG